MNTEALFLFLILLLGLLLCSFLGGNSGYEGFTINEGYTNTSTSTNGATSTNPICSGAATSAPVVGDNYNHVSGSMTSLQAGSTMYGPNGAKLVVLQNSDGTQSLNLTLPNGSTIKLDSKKQKKQDTFTKTTSPSVEKYTSYYGANGSATTFYGPNGVTASVIKGQNGEVAINVDTDQGDYTFTSNASYYRPENASNNDTNASSSTQYYGSTGYQVNTYQGAYGGAAAVATGPAGNTAYYAQGPNGNAVAGTTDPYYNTSQYYGPNGGQVNTATGPAGNTAYYAEGPNGNAVAGTTNYASSLPPGVPASQIPPGQEDLYILKSQVVPPVCPVCPAPENIAEAIEKYKEVKCTPCPRPQRCPEPSFECKKVPNYNAIGNNQLPIPVLNNFSSFGM